MKNLLVLLTLAALVPGCDDGGESCDNTACRADCRADGYADGYCNVYSGHCQCRTGECSVPDGDYYCVWRDLGGSCSGDIVDALMEQECSMWTEDAECGSFEFEEHDSSTDCDVVVYYFGELDEGGPIAISVDVVVIGASCPAACTHSFLMSF
jgi:hypothetical protein